MSSTETAAAIASPSRAAARRRPTDPEPDTADYRIVHRAMRVDLARLAGVAEDLLARPDEQRRRLLGWYLRGMVAEIRNHHTVEDAHVWPLLAALDVPTTLLDPLVDDHEQLDALLTRTEALVTGLEATGELAVVLRRLADLIGTHVEQEDREVLPLIEDRVSVADYETLQGHFRGDLRPQLLPFVVPWAVSHATPDEREDLLAGAGRPMRLVLRLFGPRFHARRRILFSPTAATREDRRLVATMRAFSAAHAALVRRTGGRIGSRWLGGSDVVLLTVRGRRTGRPHTVTLMALHDGEDLLVAASQGGVDQEPQWWLNLVADPHAEVEVRGERFAVVAERVGAHERAEVWQRFVDAYAGFETYQAKVRRQIALVRLRRLADVTGADVTGADVTGAA